MLVVISLTVAGSYSVRGIIWNNFPDYKGDWFIFWFSAQAPISDLYHDLQALPFAYPPTMLPLIKPFGLLPAWPALAAWTAIGFGFFSLALKRLGLNISTILLAALLPSLCECLVAGQTSFFVGAAMVGGVAARSTSLSALLFGLAIVLKPQSAIALPFALIALRDWRRLMMVGAVVVLFVCASVAVSGVAPWEAWTDALPRFKAMLVERNIYMQDVGVNGLRLNFGLPAWTHAFGILLGIATVAVTWSASGEPIERYTALACGSVLISPYTLIYDLAGLTVIALFRLLDDRGPKLMWFACAPIVIGLWPNLGVVAIALLQIFRHAPAMKSALLPERSRT